MTAHRRLPRMARVLAAVAVVAAVLPQVAPSTPAAGGSVTVVLGERSIPSDGSSTTTATATVLDGTGAAVASQSVQFSTDGDVTFSPAVGTTGGDGSFTTTITASRTAGAETITAATVGGSITAGGSALLYEGPGWTPASPPSPPARSSAATAYDAATGTVVLFGGDSGQTTDQLPANTPTDSDTWLWDGGTWRKQTLLTSPPPTTKASMAYDAATQTVVLFGGVKDVTVINPPPQIPPVQSNNVLSADTWIWDGKAKTWTEWTPPANASIPPARADASMAYLGSSQSGRVVLFGGYVDGGDDGATWVWDGPATGWSRLTPATSPPTRRRAVMATNPRSRSLMLFGGDIPNPPANQPSTLADTWLWDGTTWAAVTPPTAPSSRRSAVMSADLATGSDVLFGGIDASGAPLADTWTWNGARWTPQLPAPATSPPAVAGALAAGAAGYDAANQTMVMLTAGDVVTPSNTWTYLDASAATVTVSPSSIVASGIPGAATATAVVTGVDGTASTNERLGFTTDGDVTFGDVTNHHDGTYTAGVRASQTPGVETITAVPSIATVSASTLLTETPSPLPPTAPVATLPAMSNGAYGGYVTAVTIQNTGSAPSTVQIVYFDQTGAPVGTGDAIQNLPVNGSWRVRQDNGHGLPGTGGNAAQAGAAIIYSSQPVAAFVNELSPGNTGDATSYTGIPVPGGVGATLYAPTIVNDAYGGYTTGIGLFNEGAGATDVTITYRDGGGAVVKTQTLAGVASNAYRALYSGDAALALPAGFAGTATMTGPAGAQLGAIVNEIGPGGQLSSYDAVPAGSTSLKAPVALNNAFGGYYTGMGLQNTSATPGSLSVTYYDTTGTAAGPAHSFSIEANGSRGLYQGSATDGPPVGAYTAVIQSTTPLAAIVNEVAPPGAGSARQSTAYNTVPAGGGTVHLPLVENAGADPWNTGEGIMNTGTATTTVTVTYYNASTGMVLGSPYTSTLAPRALLGVYQPDASSGLPAGSPATAVVTAGSDGQVAVICNERSDPSFMSYGGQ